MKRFIYAAIASVACLLGASCSSETFEGANGVLPQASDYVDNFTIQVDQATNTAYFEFTSAKGVTPLWIIDGTSYVSQYSFSKFYRKAGTYTVECKVKSANGISDGVIVKEFKINKTQMTGFGGFDVESPDNLYADAVIGTPSFWFADGGWQQIADPTYKYDANTGEWTLNLAAGTEQRWQGQMSWTTGVALQAGVEYDFSMIMTSSNALTANGGVKIKLCGAVEGDIPVLLDKDYKVGAGEPMCLYATKLKVDSPINDLKVIFDFGGNPANTEVIMESFVLVETAKNTVEAPVQDVEWIDADSDANIFKNASLSLASIHWADGGWNPDAVADPTVTVDGNTVKIEVTEAPGPDTWQAQVHLNTGVHLSVAEKYNLKIVFNSNVDLGGVLVKPHPEGDDGTFFGENKYKVVADADSEAIYAHADGFDTDNLVLTLDFAGCPAGAVFEIKEIILQTDN